MPPHITEYFEFVEDKSLFGLTENGDYVVKSNVTTAIAKLYIFFNWEKYIAMGNSPNAIWNVMANLKNDNDPIKFNKLGYQITKPTMLQLESSQFIGLMSSEYVKTQTFTFIRIFIYIIIIFMAMYFSFDFGIVNDVWNKLVSLSKRMPFSD